MKILEVDKTQPFVNNHNIDAQLEIHPRWLLGTPQCLS